MFQRHRDFRDFGNGVEDGVHRALGAADVSLTSSVFMGEADNGFGLAVII